MKDIPQLEETLGAESRKQRLEGCSDAKVGDLAQEVDGVVFLLNGECLRRNFSGQLACSLHLNAASMPTSGSVAPMTVTSVV